MARFKLNDKIAWRMFDGNIMAGTVTFLGFSSVDVQRVDGGLCSIKDTKEAWLADPDDILTACDFFITMGR